jgi:ribosomal protein S18 acetylase RimI-like enzyme
MVDLIAHPSLSGTDAEVVMLDTVEQHLAALVAKGIPQLNMFVFADDLNRRRLLERRGYTGEEHRVHLAQSITGLPMAPELPQGFRFLDVQALDYAEQRAQLHVDAFAPGSTMNADKYRAILQAPGYDPELDVVITAPDGRFASFALAWIDMTSNMGVFEPVGTRPEFQRRGFGRAALVEAMRRMQVRGIEMATVCTTLALTGTIPFYEAAGFRQANTIWCYERTEASSPVRQSN